VAKPSPGFQLGMGETDSVPTIVDIVNQGIMTWPTAALLKKVPKPTNADI